uniref:Cytochrome c oxidase assembly protein COX15 homolog n=1 Tax=Cacopsylla melanoneura TaxID=428564 RepID=A0A8D8LTK6_9HEMI
MLKILFKKGASIQLGCKLFSHHGHTVCKSPQFQKISFNSNNSTRWSSHVATSVSKTMSNPTILAQPSRSTGYWLLGCSGMVFGAVVLGGVTRLTESGLSMVTWKLFGEKLPKNSAEWIEEFNLYKEYPEFKLKNKDISLEEFKRIWWMEYLHRMWGRCIGAAFFIPASILWYKGRFNSGMKKRVLLFGTLIGCQGLLGWYMVKSGLEDRFHTQSDVPRVSQYRLASHLSMAFVLYSGLLWTALDQLLPKEKALTMTDANRTAVLRLKRFAHLSKGFIFVTALSGAFVAGLDAGLVYNSFPLMGDRFIPSDLLAFSPTLRNFTENPTTVQFDHRILGITTFSLITAQWLMGRRLGLTPRARLALNCVAGMAYMQVALGITTLLTYVPVSIAALHQSGSLVLLSMAIWLSHEMKHIKRIVK